MIPKVSKPSKHDFEVRDWLVGRPPMSIKDMVKAGVCIKFNITDNALANIFTRLSHHGHVKFKKRASKIHDDPHYHRVIPFKVKHYYVPKENEDVSTRQNEPPTP